MITNQKGEEAIAKPSPFEKNSENRCKALVGTRFEGTVAVVATGVVVGLLAAVTVVVGRTIETGSFGVVAEVVCRSSGT